MLSRLRALVTGKAPTSIERAFCQKGFVHIPQVLAGAEVEQLRQAAIAFLPPNQPPYQPQFSNSVFFSDPFRRLFLNPRLVGTLSDLLGEDFLFVNEFGLHDSHFAGWHTDTTSPEVKGGHDFHWAPTYVVVNAAIYLQNNNDNGSGLDVVPGSHQRDDPVALGAKGKKPADPYKDAITIPSRAGDLIVFHQRLSHRASEAKRPARNDAERKIAIFLIAGANNQSTRRYRQWLVEYDRMNGTIRPDLPQDFLSFLRAQRLAVI